ncbi:MAG: hypothetical protein KAY37_03030 [Phycisphaerae bacterium]|nr:hypothetical protein [Phycisphaerae bacterium]
MYISRLSVAMLCLSLVVLASGCTMGQYHRLEPQSHFSYPNSNVQALGPVNVKIGGSASWLTFPSYMTSEIDQKAYNAALSQVHGSNLIIDYVRTTTIKVIPILYIFWTEERLEGTAAKMDIGQQILR